MELNIEKCVKQEENETKSEEEDDDEMQEEKFEDALDEPDDNDYKNDEKETKETTSIASENETRSDEKSDEEMEMKSCEEELSYDNDDEDEFSKWFYMPDFVLLIIFQYLNPRQLLTAGEVCKSWNRVSRDELLWKALFYRTYKIDTSVGIMPGENFFFFLRVAFVDNFVNVVFHFFFLQGKTSWLSEFKRLAYHIPLVETETLKEHGHQVLHVSFSHNGKMFATCSKDGWVVVSNT